MVILFSRHPCMRDNRSYNFALLLTRAQCSVVLNVFFAFDIAWPRACDRVLIITVRKGKSQTLLLSLNICVWKTECGLDIAFLFLSKEAREISLNEHTGAKDKTIVIFYTNMMMMMMMMCVYSKRRKKIQLFFTFLFRMFGYCTINQRKNWWRTLRIWYQFNILLILHMFNESCIKRLQVGAAGARVSHNYHNRTHCVTLSRVESPSYVGVRSPLHVIGGCSGERRQNRTN